MIKIEIKSIFGKVLFTYEKENNTIKDTLLEAIKQCANLYGANLKSANLYGANLESANLYGANLESANLYGANLESANLYGANLESANLYGANLESANLKSANLYGANLRSANLYGANLYGANLRKEDILNLIAQCSILPEGELIVWKKLQNNLLAKLKIPAKAKRINAFGYRKCRFEFAIVLAIYNGNKKVKTGYSQHDAAYKYEVGETIYPDSFDPSPLTECSHGINAFITKVEAINY